MAPRSDSPLHRIQRPRGLQGVLVAAAAGAAFVLALAVTFGFIGS